MTYLGKVRGGKVELADEAVSTGIRDLSEQHDHYAHGTPKRG